MEKAAWIVLAALGLADKLEFIFGALFLIWLYFEVRSRRD